jgi:hypothetical protein
VITVRNLSWLRGLTEFPRDFGSRMGEIFSDVTGGINTLEQQAQGNCQGTPHAPPAIQAVRAQAHEGGVEVAISHTADIYRGIQYYADWSEDPHLKGARTTAFGESRNGVIPSGSRAIYFQVRAKYPWSDSTAPVIHPTPIKGGIASATLLPVQGCGTALPNEPPHLQPAYRGAKPPVRSV